MSWVERTITIAAPVDDCFSLWADPQAVTRMIPWVDRAYFEGKAYIWHWLVMNPESHWEIGWTTVVDSMVASQVLAWHSMENTPLDSSGVVHFKALDDNRTEVRLELMLAPPPKLAVEFVSDVFLRPERQADEILARFRRLAERESVGVSARSLRHRDAEGHTSIEIPMGNVMGGFQTAGTAFDTAETVEGEMAAHASAGEQGGSGGTGGPLTGETTPGGMSEDLSRGVAGGGRYGGPTGADVGSGGKGPGSGSGGSAVARGGAVKAFDEEADTGMAEKIAAENASKPPAKES